MTDWLDNFICGKFLGLPLAETRGGDDDCRRYNYHLKIDEAWHEVCTECLSFNRKEALESLQRLFRKLAEAA
jgi:hypothetical protein